MMTRFVEQAISRAGLAPVMPARGRGDFAAVKDLLASLPEVDLLPLGAVADMVRAVESGDIVRVHTTPSDDVRWIMEDNELALLRQVAIARITSPIGCKIGVDWGHYGLELAQVALGFGATDLVGPITRKAGALITDDELKKVKGQGMVARATLRRREIAALIRCAGRSCEFTNDEDSEPAERDAGGRGGAQPPVQSGSASAEPPRSSLDSVQQGWTPSNSVQGEANAEPSGHGAEPHREEALHA